MEKISELSDGAYTPWGKAQSVKRIAPGIQQVSTAGHGGFKLDRKTNALIPAPLREKGGWYEEDLKVCAVIVAFGLGSQDAIESARASLKDWYPDQYTAAYGTPVLPEESRTLRERAAMLAAKGKLHAYCATDEAKRGVPPGMVKVCAKIDGSKGLGTGPERYFLIPTDKYKFVNGICAFTPDMYEEVSSW